MDNKHSAAIAALVSAYCEQEGLTPIGHEAVVSVRVKFAPLDPDFDLVPMEILEARFMPTFGNWITKMVVETGDGTFYLGLKTRIRHAMHNYVLERMSERFGHEIGLDEVTIRQVCQASKGLWMREHGLGDKGVESINQFLGMLYPGLRIVK